MPTLREVVPIRRRKILKKTFARIIGMGVISLIVSVLYVCVVNPALIGQVPELRIFDDYQVAAVIAIWLVFTFILSLPALFWEWLYFRNYFYDIDDKNVIIRKGVITTKEATLPFNKITDVYVDQDIHDVIFGIYDVHISTPTVDSGLFAHIDGVNKEGSVEIRRLILDRINNPESDEKRDEKRAEKAKGN